MNLIAKVVIGSRLYGTDTPTSDFDHRYVYLPSLEDCLLNRVRHSFAATDEKDGHYFSLTEFLRLAFEGQSLAIEMLHAPLGLETHPIWSKLSVNAHRFHTKAMLQMVGFAVTMSEKYGTRIDRLREVQAILLAIDQFRPSADAPYVFETARLGDVWDALPESPHVIKTLNPSNPREDKRVYSVCGREMQVSARLHHVYAAIERIELSYGERVRDAKEGKTDWRSIHHAFRAAFQLREILDTGTLHFPLKDAEWLREVKLGHIDFFANSLDKRLDDLIAEVSDKMAKSSLPDKVDQKWIDDIVLDAYGIQQQHEWFKSRAIKLL